MEFDQPFMEAGLNSLGAIDLRNALTSRFSIDLPSTATFNFPTIATMSQHIADYIESAQAVAFTQLEDCHVNHDHMILARTTLKVVGSASTFPGRDDSAIDCTNS